MNVLYAAYNDYGDLIASDYNIIDLICSLERAGYSEWDYAIARVHA